MKFVLNLLSKYKLKHNKIESNWDKYKQLTKISPSCIITPSASLVIFTTPENPHTMLEIGQNSHIYSQFNLLREKSNITIGERCQLGSVNFNCAHSISVGNDVLMAWGITIIDHDSHSLEWKYRKNDAKQSYEDYLRYGDIVKNKDWSHVSMKPIIIGNKCWIGFNVIVLKGVTLSEGCIVGAGSVVTKDAPPYSLIAGNPAKIIKRLSKV